MGAGSSSASQAFQSHEVPNSRVAGYSPVYRHYNCAGELVQYPAQAKTLYESFQAGVKANPHGPCMGKRPVDESGKPSAYVWETYTQVNQRITNFAHGLAHLGIEPKQHVGIYSVNRVEWAIAEQACYLFSLVVVSLYDTFGPEAIAYIINEAELHYVVCSADKVAKLLAESEKHAPLKCIIQMEPVQLQEHKDSAQAKGIRLLTFAEVEELGHQHASVPLTLPTSDDLATIMYTSGTTGAPKGVMLSHGNVIASQAAAEMHGVNLHNDDVLISYLPMAHIFERLIQSMTYMNGGSVGFYRGDVRGLFDDITELRPTLFPSVPRLFTRLFDKVNMTLEKGNPVKRFLYDWGYQVKKRSLDIGVAPETPIWDAVVFSTFQQRLGGRVRLIITGSAPISPSVYQFLQVCFCCPILQGYGLTENSAAGMLTLPNDYSSGHVGIPCASNEVRLADVADMGYTSDDKPNPRGEVCFRGYNIFLGYYKQPEKSKEVLDEDGWFHTGDIGMLNPNGTFTIIDRKKNIFKLSQGEYVAAEFIEGVLAKSKFVSQIFVYGDSLQSQLVAVVVPDEEVLIPWANNHGQQGETLEALVSNPEIKKTILKDITDTGKAHQLRGFEYVKDIYLSAAPFTVENDLMTPTFKLKRPQLKDRFGSHILAMYDNLEKVNAANAGRD